MVFPSLTIIAADFGTSDFLICETVADFSVAFDFARPSAPFVRPFFVAAFPFTFLAGFPISILHFVVQARVSSVALEPLRSVERHLVLSGFDGLPRGLEDRTWRLWENATFDLLRLGGTGQAEKRQRGQSPEPSLHAGRQRWFVGRGARIGHSPACGVGARCEPGAMKVTGTQVSAKPFSPSNELAFRSRERDCRGRQIWRSRSVPAYQPGDLP